MPYKQRNGCALYYEVQGQGEPLIFLHGLGGSMEQVQALFPQLDHIQLILIDQRGHGKSTGSFTSYTFADLAEDVLAIADELHLAQFSIAGISMGAAVSVYLLLHAPKRIKKTLLIRNAWINEAMSPSFRSLYALLADCLKKKEKARFQANAYFCELQMAAPAAAASLLQCFDDPAARRYPEKFIEIPKQKPFQDLFDLHQIKQPVMILANPRDPIHPFAFGQCLHAHIPHSSFYEIISKSENAAKQAEQIAFYLHAFL